MNSEWIKYFEDIHTELLAAKTMAENVYILCRTLNFCLSVETPLEVIDALKNLNTQVWVLAAIQRQKEDEYLA